MFPQIINKLINFEKIILTNEIFLNFHYYYPSQKKNWFGRNNFWKNFYISENNIISVELAKVLLTTRVPPVYNGGVLVQAKNGDEQFWK